MSVTLTIKADVTGVQSALRSVNDLIETAIKQTERLAGATAQVMSAWRKTADAVKDVASSAASAARATQEVAAVAGTTKTEFTNSALAVRTLNRELGTTLALMNSIRGASNALANRGGSSGFGGTTRALALAGGGGSGGGIIDVPFTVNGPNSSARPSSGGSAPSGFFSDRARQSYAPGMADLGISRSIDAALSSAATTARQVVGRGLREAWDDFTTAAKIAAVTAAGLVANSVRLAMKSEPIQGGFAALTSANGLGDQVKVLNELRDAARGTVSDLDLMQSSNKALMLGAARTTEELSLLVEGGRRLGKTMGVDATEGFNLLATGIGRHSSRILDDLGIVVKSQEAYEKYAKSHETTTDKLSEEEKALIFTSAAYEALNKHLRQQGEEQLSAGDKVDRAKTSFENLSKDLGQKFLPVVGEVADKWATFLESLSPDDIESGMKSAVEAAKGAAKSVTEFFLPKNIADDAANIAGDFWNAFANPSKEAFKIVALEMKKFWNDATAQAEAFWESAKQNWKINSSVVVGEVGRAIGSKSMTDAADNAQRESLMAIAKPLMDAKIQNAAIDEQIAGLRATIGENKKNQANAAPDGMLTTATKTTTTSTSAALANATAQREAEDAAREAEKKAKKDAEDALRRETREREKLLHTLEDERAKIQAKIDDYQAANANAAAALRGEDDPTRTIPQRLDALAGTLRGFPSKFSDIGEKLAENAKSMQDAMNDWRESLDKAFVEIGQSIERRANSFLQEGPQDGETVRVRAMKRRAQRDLARQNNAMINEAFRSPDIPKVGILDAQMPSLERALLNLRNADGTTEMQRVQERIADMVNEHARQVEKIRDQEAKILEEQKAAHDAQSKTQDEIISLMGQSISELGVLKADAVSKDKQIAQLQKELERIARLAKR